VSRVPSTCVASADVAAPTLETTRLHTFDKLQEMASQMLKWAKGSAKKFMRSMGVEAHGYIPGSSRDAQLMAAMRRFGITQVYDIGANAGQFGLELIDHGYRGSLVSVEPLTEPHALLSRAAARHASWTVNPPTAVGAAAGHVSFHVSANSVSSSALEVLDASVVAAPGSRQVEKRMVPVTTVDALVRTHGLVSTGAMLKVDTQGYEWAVLDGAAESLQRFDLVLLELSLSPLYLGQRLWLDLIQRMSGSGYAVWSLLPEFTDPEAGRTLQINGLFFRMDLLQPAK
jgi:FkbM family methyltransferase